MIKSVEEGLEVYKKSLRDYLAWARDEKEKEDPSALAGNSESILYARENTRRLLALGTIAEVLKLSEKEKAQIESEIRKEIKTP